MLRLEFHEHFGQKGGAEGGVRRYGDRAFELLRVELQKPQGAAVVGDDGRHFAIGAAAEERELRGPRRSVKKRFAERGLQRRHGAAGDIGVDAFALTGRLEGARGGR